jgi:ATP-dependent Lon protease
VEIPDNIKGKLEIKTVRWIDEVLQVALTRQPTPRPETPEEADPVAVTSTKPTRRGRRNNKQVQAH